MTTYETALFEVDHQTRRIRGVLIPWGVRSRPNVTKNKPVTFARSSVRVPRDPSVVTLNLAHDRFSPLGRAVSLVDEELGLVAEFALADTDEADAWLSDRGDFVRLSAEVKDLRRDAEDYGTAQLTGAALVDDGAFEGAALFALDVVDEDADEEPDDTEERDMEVATAPETMLAGSQARRAAPLRLTKEGFFTALETARRAGDPSPLAPYVKSAEETGLFALSNITYDDANGLAADAGIPHTWLGELAAGARFQRTVVPLLTSGVLRSLVATGWVWLTRPSMGLWAGNKTAIPSNAPTVGPKDFTAQRFAGGHDLAREYYDFNVTEVINSYVEAMVDSYYVLSDDFALDQLVAGATAFTPTASTVSGQLAQMARQVLAARVTPTFAIVAPNVFDAFTDVANSDASAYFSPTIGIADGDLKGIPLIPDDRLAAGTALVGSRAAATAWELPGVPIRVQAADLVLGGMDNAFFGYIAVGVTYPAGLVKSTITIPAPAAVSSSSKK